MKTDEELLTMVNLKLHLMGGHGASALYMGDETVDIEHYQSVHDFHHSREGKESHEENVSN